MVLYLSEILAQGQYSQIAGGKDKMKNKLTNLIETLCEEPHKESSAFLGMRDFLGGSTRRNCR